MNLPQDIKQITKLTWQRHAARNISFFFSCFHLNEGYIEYYPRYINTRFQYVAAEGKGRDWMMYRNIEEQIKVDQWVDKLIHSQDFLKQIIAKTEQTLSNLKRVSVNINKINTKRVGNKILVQSLQSYGTTLALYTSAMSTIIFTGEACGRYITCILKRKKLTQIEIDQIIGLLSTPIQYTLPIQEEIEFIKKMERVRSNKKAISFLQKKELPPLLARHFRDYFWLTAYVDGEPWTKQEFLSRVETALNEKNLLKKAAAIERHARQKEKEIAKTVAKLKLDPDFIRSFRQIIYHRILGESIYGYSNVRLKNTFTQVARRLYLSVKQVKYLTLDEIKQALEGGRLSIQRVIEKRMRHYIIITGKNDIHIFSGNQADQVLKCLKIKESKIAKKSSLIKGTPASPGVVRARAKVVKSVEEIGKVNKGDILVTLNTTPSFVPAMKLASAILTDEGGVTCHAAIVSRELNIPCVIGTKIATCVLKDGDLVEVDATRGLVKKI